MVYERGKFPTRSILFVFFLATLVVAAEIGLYLIRWIVLTVAIGICLGVIIAPMVNYCDRRKTRFRVPRPLAAASVLGAVAFALIFVVFGLLSIGAEQIEGLHREIPEFSARIAGKLKAAGLPSFQDQLASLDITQNIGEILQKLVGGIRLGGAAVGAVVVILVIAAYIAVSPSYYLSIALRLVPAPSRPRAHEISGAIAHNLRRWFLCQALAMTVVGVLITIGLWLIDVDHWLLFGIATGLLDIIPFIGNTIPAVAAIIVSFADAPERIPWIIALYVGVNQLENHLLLPLILKSRMNFPPVLLLISMLVLGSFFGIVGLLITPGLFSIVQTLLQETTETPDPTAAVE